MGEEWMIHGIYRPLPEPGLLRAGWNLSEGVVDQLETHEVYLHALQAEPVSEDAA